MSVGFAALAWWAVIGLLFYRWELIAFAKNGFKKTTAETKIFPGGQAVKQSIDAIAGSKDSPLFSSVHELMDELNILFTAGCGNKYIREELIIALKLTVRNYYSLKDTNFKTAIDNHIRLQSRDTFKIELSESDLKQIWEDRKDPYS